MTHSLAWGFGKPEPPQAKPKLGLSGQARLEQHYTDSETLGSFPAGLTSSIKNLFLFRRTQHICQAGWTLSVSILVIKIPPAKCEVLTSTENSPKLQKKVL